MKRPPARGSRFIFQDIFFAQKNITNITPADFQAVTRDISGDVGDIFLISIQQEKAASAASNSATIVSRFTTIAWSVFTTPW